VFLACVLFGVRVPVFASMEVGLLCFIVLLEILMIRVSPANPWASF